MTFLQPHIWFGIKLVKTTSAMNLIIIERAKNSLGEMAGLHKLRARLRSCT